MKKQRHLSWGACLSVVLLILCLALISWAPKADAKMYRMKIQSAYPHGDLSMELLKEFAASAEKRSNGQIKISVFAEPELVPWEQLFEATKRGTLDMRSSE